MIQHSFVIRAVATPGVGTMLPPYLNKDTLRTATAQLSAHFAGLNSLTITGAPFGSSPFAIVEWSADAETARVVREGDDASGVLATLVVQHFANRLNLTVERVA